MQSHPLFRTNNIKFKDNHMTLYEIGKHLGDTRAQKMTLVESRKHFTSLGLNYDKVVLYYIDVCSMELRFQTNTLNDTIRNNIEIQKPIKPVKPIKPIKPKPIHPPKSKTQQIIDDAMKRLNLKPFDPEDN